LKLRKGEHTNKNGKKVNYRGIHTVFSGYNEAVRQYYGAETDPVEIVNKLVKDGVVETRPGKKGPYLFLKGEAPVPKAEMWRAEEKLDWWRRKTMTPGL